MSQAGCIITSNMVSIIRETKLFRGLTSSYEYFSTSDKP